jgi:hypothetical protein
LENINRQGIGVVGTFIYGSDDETREKMFARADFIIRNRIDVMQQSKLTSFPGGVYRIIGNSGVYQGL